jgi:hypothetical protein
MVRRLVASRGASIQEIVGAAVEFDGFATTAVQNPHAGTAQQYQTAEYVFNQAVQQSSFLPNNSRSSSGPTQVATGNSRRTSTVSDQSWVKSLDIYLITGIA